MTGSDDGDPGDRTPAPDPVVGAAGRDAVSGPVVDAAGRESAPDLLIGTPERDSAREALEAHLAAKRLDPAEYERREEAAQLARTRSELMRLFADLPLPHPELPAAAVPAVPAAEPVDETPPPVFLAGCLLVVLGLPVTVVLGYVYGLWWTLAVPVVVTAVMTYVEHLRSVRRDRAQDSLPQSPEGS